MLEDCCGTMELWSAVIIIGIMDSILSTSIGAAVIYYLDFLDMMYRFAGIGAQVALVAFCNFLMITGIIIEKSCLLWPALVLYWKDIMGLGAAASYYFTIYFFYDITDHMVLMCIVAGVAWALTKMYFWLVICSCYVEMD